jgi:hypothetical protein
MDDVLASVFIALYWRRRVRLEKTNTLVSQYQEIAEIWQEHCSLVDCYNIHCHTDFGEPPDPDAKFAPTKPYTGPELKEGCAPDVPMLLDRQEKTALCLIDYNMTVEDPEREYAEFKRRLCWSPEEKALFIEKWALHPKNFPKLSPFFPDKTVKDLIEHYYLTKKDGTAMLTGKKKIGKKLIAEGKVHHAEAPV